MVVHGEIDGQRRRPETGQFTCAVQAVVAVGAHPIAEGQSEEDHERCRRSAENTETGVTLSHIVQEGGHHDLAVAAVGGHDHQGGVIAVTLVSGALLEEDAGQLGGEPGPDGCPLGLCQRFRRGDVEETSEQVGR